MRSQSKEATFSIGKREKRAMRTFDFQQIVVTYFFLLFSSLMFSFISDTTAGYFLTLTISAILVLFGLLFKDHIISYALITAALTAVVKNFLPVIRNYVQGSNVSVVLLIVQSAYLVVLIIIASYFLCAYKKQNWLMVKAMALNAALLVFLVLSVGLSSLGLIFLIPFMVMGQIEIGLLVAAACSFLACAYIAARKPFALQFGLRELIYAFFVPVASLLVFHPFNTIVGHAVGQDAMHAILLIIAAIFVFLCASIFKTSSFRYGLILSGLFPAFEPFFAMRSAGRGPLFDYICLALFIIIFFAASYVLSAMDKHGLKKITATAVGAALLIFLSTIIGGWFASLSFIDSAIRGTSLM